MIITVHSPGLQKLNLGRSAHVSLVIESLPFPAAPSIYSVSVPRLPLQPPPTPLATELHWPSATLNYHWWKENQIRRRAWNSETGSRSLTVQKENNSNERSLLPMLRVWINCDLRGHNQRTWCFLDGGQVLEQPTRFSMLRQTYCTLNLKAAFLLWNSSHCRLSSKSEPSTKVWKATAACFLYEQLEVIKK